MENVLIIEDDPTMLRGLKDNFEYKGYGVLTARDGEKGLKAALTEQPDIIILDIMLPKINGFEVCSQIRRNVLDMPIIILSARYTESDVVMGLNLGADDYVTKPFSIKELLARAEAFMRRRKSGEPDLYRFGDFLLDTITETLTRKGQQVKLSPGQFKMLHLFLRKAGYTLTCDEILDTVWGYSRFVTSRDIDKFIIRLREQIEPDPNQPTFIHTITDNSYKFELPEQDGNSFNN